MCGLLRLPEVKGGRLAFISLAMGLAYLGYDLSVFFLPASLGLLAWHRRWRSAFYSAILQMAPMALWVFALHFIFHQPLGNANTLAYSLTFPAYTHMPSMRDWWPILREAPDVFMEIFFGANFIFVPMLFIGVLALNSVTSRIRIWHAEVALLLSAVLLFSFLNLAPPYHAGWMMRGTWIARLYQPMFPALVFFAARWWQNLPPITWIEKILIGCLLAAVVFGNVLVEFGPILDNPLKVSEAAFYRFYDHSDFHDVYEHNLAFFGRRPLGFIKPQPREPTADEILAGIRKQIASINQAIAANRLVLAENRKAYAADARSLAATRAALKSLGHEIKPAKGEIDPIEDQSSTLSEQDNLPPIPATGGLADVEDELGTANAELAAVEKRVLQAQLDLTLIRAELADAEAEYSRAQSEHSH